MYRAVALLALRQGAEPGDGPALGRIAREMDLELGPLVLVEGEDVTAAIRSAAVDGVVSQVAAHPEVRAELLARQRAWTGSRRRGVVEGRDIGSVVLPDAELKVYLDAHPEVRAARRAGQDRPGGSVGTAPTASLEEVASSIAARDRLDSSRASSPLVVAEGALVVDSTEQSVEEVVEVLLNALAERGLLDPDPAGPTRADPAPPAPHRDASEGAAPTAAASSGRRPGGAKAAGGKLPELRPITKGELAFYALCRAIAVGASRVVLPGPVVGGEELPRKGAYVLAPSHRSYVDWLVAARVTRRRLRYLVKAEVWRSRAAGRLLELLGAFPVHRGTADRQAFNRALEVLAAGEPLVIFPEGTRTEGPLIQELQEGAAYLALRAGVPIYPVGLGGTERSMPRGARLPRPTRVRVVVGRPVLPGEAPAPGATGRVSRASTRAVSELLRARLQAALDEAEGRTGPAGG